MNMQAIRAIDGALGLAVLLLLAVAIIAGQGHPSLSVSEVNDVGRQSESLGVAPSPDQYRTLTEIRPIADRMKSASNNIGLVFDVHKQDSTLSGTTTTID